MNITPYQCPIIILPLRILLVHTFLTGIQSKEELTDLVGNVEVANAVYRDWVGHQDYVWQQAAHSAGFMTIMIAMEGLGTLGVNGYGATKFETYTCEVRICMCIVIVSCDGLL